MATMTFAGVFRSDAGFDNTAVFTAGNSFSSDLITQIEVDLGADATILDGDGESWDATTNESPTDPTQTYDDGSGPGALTYDFTVELIGSDGNTYYAAVFDYDINNDGDFGTGTQGEEDPNENSYFMAFVGDAFPPPGVILTTNGVITDNSPNLPVGELFYCFARGASIQTQNGPTNIEDLKVGDLVQTRDNGLQPIRWIGASAFDSIDLAVNPKLKPILIRADALGAGYPKRDLLVSPQHRVLVRSAIAQRMFGTDEVLIPANKLVVLDGIDVYEARDGIEYFHMLFDQHEVVESNGAWTESLFTGPEALKAVGPEARKEIETIFPEICEPTFEPIAARHIPQTGKLMKKLAERHQKNRKPLYSAA